MTFQRLQKRQFGPYPIEDTQAFAETKLSFAFVNIKPVVPGHVLISPHRVVQTFEDLTGDEVCDLWCAHVLKTADNNNCTISAQRAQSCMQLQVAGAKGWQGNQASLQGGLIDICGPGTLQPYD